VVSVGILRFWTIVRLPFGRTLAIFLLLFCQTGLILALEWGGYANTYGVDTRTDSTRISSIDQQYSFTVTSSVAPALDYYGSLRYRHTQTRQTGEPTPWTVEVAPSVGMVWTSSFFRLRGAYEFRDNRNRGGLANMTSRSASADWQSAWDDFPSVRVSYRHDQNNNDLDLLGIDTRQNNLSGMIDYRVNTTRLGYEFQDAVTTNTGSGFEQRSRSHSGRFENGLSLFNRIVSVQSAYQVVARNERTTTAPGQTILITLPAAQGLYLASPSPDFNHLENLAALIDGNLTAPASELMNLSGQDVHNIGLDFGAPVDLDRLYLYTDTLAAPDLLWAVYAGADNQNWSLVQSARIVTFNQFYLRYEIEFPRQTTRYIKLVSQPAPRVESVHVTELRALIASEETVKPGWAADHRATLRVGIRPKNWISASVDANYLRVDARTTALKREQDGVSASLALTPTRLLGFSAQYQLGRTSYSGQSSNQTDTDLMGASLTSQWLGSLRSAVSGSRRREISHGQTTRQLDALSLRLETRILPTINGSTELGISKDHLLTSNTRSESRYLTQSLYMRATSRMQLTGSYYVYGLSSGAGPSSRQSLNLTASYRLTSTMNLQGSGSSQWEPGRHSLDWNGGVSWSALPKLFLSANAQRTVPWENDGSLLLNTQAAYQFSARADINASYSFTHSYRTSSENQTSLRLGINLAI
jgi:hypothetical protein